jgi:Flp pilus assembly protein CpaB
MNVDTVVVLIAIATIFGLVGVVVIDSILTTQEAEAKGCTSSLAVNASKGRYFKG